MQLACGQKEGYPYFIEAVWMWSNFLYGRPFTLKTDQITLAFIFDKSCRG